MFNPLTISIYTIISCFDKGVLLRQIDSQHYDNDGGSTLDKDDMYADKALSALTSP